MYSTERRLTLCQTTLKGEAIPKKLRILKDRVSEKNKLGILVICTSCHVVNVQECENAAVNRRRSEVGGRWGCWLVRNSSGSIERLLSPYKPFS